MNKTVTNKSATKLKNSDDYYPRSFVNYLISACTNFAELPKKQQHLITANLWAATGSRLRHSNNELAFTMHWRSRKSMYGSASKFHEINNILKWFELIEGAKIHQHIAQAWVLTDSIRKLLYEYFNIIYTEKSNYALGLIKANEKGCDYRIANDGIRSRTNSGSNTKHPREIMRGAIEINGEALHKFYSVGEAWLNKKSPPTEFEWAFEIWDAIAKDNGLNGGIARARKRVNDAIVEASALLHIAKSSNVERYVLPMTYCEYPSGRLFAEGAHNLQTCRREVRRAALMGAWDVDVSNCHWALIEQMAARLKLNTPLISNYLENKIKIRQEVAFAGGISETDAKKLLIGLIYGMNLKASKADRRHAIIDMIGIKSAEKLRSFKPLHNLFLELTQLRKIILKEYEIQTKRKQCIVNDFNNAISLRATAAEKFAHILQGAEAAILSTVIKNYGSELKLLAHDGWVMVNKPDKNSLEATIKLYTGYSVDLEINQL